MLSLQYKEADTNFFPNKQWIPIFLAHVVFGTDYESFGKVLNNPSILFNSNQTPPSWLSQSEIDILKDILIQDAVIPVN